MNTGYQHYDWRIVQRRPISIAHSLWRQLARKQLPGTAVTEPSIAGSGEVALQIHDVSETLRPPAQCRGAMNSTWPRL